MSEIDLAEVKARADAASPGPWYPETDPDASPGVWTDRGAELGFDTNRAEDAEFIAHARTDVPALLARIAELEAERDAGFLELAGYLADAERRGYERAVARLRDNAAVNAYLDANDWPETRIVPPRVYADYLDAVKDNTDD
jgi:hypothetical protein